MHDENTPAGRPEARGSGARRALLTLCVLALLAVTLQSLVFSGASFTSLSGNPSNSFEAGSVSHTNSADGVVVLNVTGMRPGLSRSAELTLTGGPDSPAMYTVADRGVEDVPATSGGPALSAALNLTIDDVTGATQQIYSGTVAALGTRDLQVIDPGEVRRYRFTLTWPAASSDPLLQGASMTLTVQFTGVSL